MTQPYSILHLCDSLSVGGAERLVLGLAGQMRGGRFALHVASLGVRRGNLLQPEFERLGVPVHIIGAQRFYDPAALAAVVRTVRANQIDLIHTHLTSADIVGRLAGRITGKPVVSTLHNEPYDYDRQRGDRRLMQRLTARRATTMLVAVSRRLREMYLAAWKLAPDRIVTIMNATPLDTFLAVPERPTNPDEVVITNIGRLNPQKAQALLLEATKPVLEQRPRARLRIVGQGRLEHELKQHAQTLEIAGRVSFDGVRPDVAAVLGESDIFVLSSRWEGLPVTAVEAMAAARPLVLTDVGGCRDLVEHGVHGLLVPPGDVTALSAALLRLVDDGAERRAFGRAARERARTMLGMPTFAAHHEALYASLLQISTRETHSSFGR